MPAILGSSFNTGNVDPGVAAAAASKTVTRTHDVAPPRQSNSRSEVKNISHLLARQPPTVERLKGPWDGDISMMAYYIRG